MSSRPTSKRGASKAKTESGRKAWLLSIPGWAWAVSGIVAGFFVAWLFLSSPRSVYVRNIVTKSIKAEKQMTAEPVFDFYTLLPESQGWVTEPEEKSTLPRHEKEIKHDKQDKQNDAIKPADNKQLLGHYLLQVGSFRNLKDADRLRAELILWGLSPKVEKANIGNGESWHRVQIGPFKDKESLLSAQKMLAKHNIDSLLLKLR